MPNYKYKAISLDGAAVSGVIEAYDEFEAVEAIKRSHRIVTAITLVDKKKSILQMTIGSPMIKEESLALMCSQFAIVLKAGMPIARCVELIAGQTANRDLRRLLEEVAKDVGAGYGLAQSFENKGVKMLPVTLIETLRAGEESGTIETSFAKLHVYFDRNAKTQKKVRGAMVYPIFLMILAAIVIAIIMGVAMPVFIDMFSGLSIELPAPTRLLMAISNFFAKGWLAIIIVIAALTIGFMLLRRTEKGRLFLARLQLQLPLIGHIALMDGASQLANTMATMLSSGLTIVKAVALCGKVMNNYYLGTQLISVVSGLEEGRPLGACMKKCDCFPNMLVEMASVGDETGSLENTLETIGEYYASEAEMAASRALNALQPAITVVMGIVIGFIVIALYLPMFNMYTAI